MENRTLAARNPDGVTQKTRVLRIPFRVSQRRFGAPFSAFLHHMSSSSSSGAPGSANPDGGSGGGGGGDGASTSPSAAPLRSADVMTTGVSRAASAAKSSALAALAAFVEATQGGDGENLPPVEELTVEHVTKESFWGSFIFCK